MCMLKNCKKSVDKGITFVTLVTDPSKASSCLPRDLITNEIMPMDSVSQLQH